VIDMKRATLDRKAARKKTAGPLGVARRTILLTSAIAVIALANLPGAPKPLVSPAIGETSAQRLPAPPADGVMGFLVTEFQMPVIQGKDACPDGPVPRLRDGFVESLDPAERTRLLLAENKKELEESWRAYAFGANGTNICTNPEMFDRPVMRTVQSPLGWGIDLDGVDGAASGDPDACPQADFISPAGERGIDNQEYRALGCTLEFRGKDGVSGEIGSGMQQFLKSGEWTQVILLRGVDSLVHDDDVEVIYANTPDRPFLDHDGNFLRDGTFTISTEAPRHRNVLKGRIVNGVLSTEPADIELTQTWGQGGTRDIRGNRTIFDYRKGRLRLAFQPDGTLEGMLGGFRPLIDTFSAQTLGGAGTALVAGIDCATYMSTVKHFADGLKNPKTGKCEGISSAQSIKAIPAFVNDAPLRPRTAKR
jgi:hypothetical protein